MSTLSLDDLTRATLARQMLLAREKASPREAIGRLLALQAQWPKPPFFALHARLEGFQREALVKAVRKNEIVRGTAYRGTIFVMTAKDYAAFRPSLQPLLDRAVKSIVGKRLPEKGLDRIVETGRALFGDKPRTFDDLRDALAKNAKPTDDIRAMAYLVRLKVPLLQVASDVPWGWHAACDFALANSLVATPFTEAGEAATDALVLRYLAALGPATIADAQTFTGLAGLKAAFERLRPKLVTFHDDRKKELFDLPKAPRPAAGAEPPVRFLPEFDNIAIGHADRRRFIADEHKKHVYLPGLVVARTFVLGGRAGGVWKITTTKKAATLVIEPFAPLVKKAKAALEEEGERLIRFAEPEIGSHELSFAKPLGR
jgi:hypothetical protein